MAHDDNSDDDHENDATCTNADPGHESKTRERTGRARLKWKPSIIKKEAHVDTENLSAIQNGSKWKIEIPRSIQLEAPTKQRQPIKERACLPRRCSLVLHDVHTVCAMVTVGRL